jgi:hypothetical protein
LKGKRDLEYKTLNNVNSKDVQNEGRLKEYTYPPLPNIPSVRKAFIRQRLDDMNNKAIDADPSNTQETI